MRNSHSSANYIPFGVVNMNNEHWNGCSACLWPLWSLHASVSDLGEGKKNVKIHKSNSYRIHMCVVLALITSFNCKNGRDSSWKSQFDFILLLFYYFFSSVSYIVVITMHGYCGIVENINTICTIEPFRYRRYRRKEWNKNITKTPARIQFDHSAKSPRTHNQPQRFQVILNSKTMLVGWDSILN